MRRRGFTLIELVVVMLITAAVSSALFVFFVDTIRNDRVIQGVNEADKGAREQLDTLVDHVRNAQQYREDADDDYRVISAATATSIEYYVNAAGDTVRYYLAGGELRRDDTAIGGGDTLVFSNVQSLELSYFVATSQNYYTGVAPTTDPHVPSGEELPLLTQIDLRIVVEIDGQPREMFSQLRLRNSPRKERL